MDKNEEKRIIGGCSYDWFGDCELEVLLGVQNPRKCEYINNCSYKCHVCEQKNKKIEKLRKILKEIKIIADFYDLAPGSGLLKISEKIKEAENEILPSK